MTPEDHTSAVEAVAHDIVARSDLTHRWNRPQIPPAMYRRAEDAYMDNAREDARKLLAALQNNGFDIIRSTGVDLDTQSADDIIQALGLGDR